VLSSSKNVTINKPTPSIFFNSPDALPVAQPTVSEHLKERFRDVYMLVVLVCVCVPCEVADAEVRIVRASNYVRVVEEALRKTTGGNDELEEELGRARDELASATRQREEGEAEQRLADALLQRSFGVREHAEDQLERLTFRKVSLWQHAATYLLYFVMLMNVFVTTFGISGGVHGSVFGGGPAAAAVHQTSSTLSTTLAAAASTTQLPRSTNSMLSSSPISALLANITTTTPAAVV